MIRLPLTHVNTAISLRYGRYSIKTGLPEPSSQEEVQRRQEQLENWKSVIRRLEQDAKDYKY